MAFYLFLIVYIFISGIIITRYVTVTDKIKKIMLALFLCLPLFLITALRGPLVGNDTTTYLNYFTKFQSYDHFFDNDTRFEIGFVILCRLLGFITKNPQILLIVCAAVTDFFFFRFIFKYSKMIWFSIYIFIGLRLMFFTMSGLRQSLAMALVLFSYDYIIQRKPIKFIICITIAALFHTAVVCCIPLYLISFYKFNAFIVGITVSISLIVFIFFDVVLKMGITIFPQYSGYIDGEKFGEFLLGNAMLFLIQVLIMTIGIISGYCFKQQSLVSFSRNTVILHKFNEKDFLSYAALFSMILCMFSLRGSTLDRFYSYYQVFVMIYIPHAMLNINKISYRSIIIVGFCVFLLVFIVIIFVFRPEWSTVFPYKFFWEQ